MANLIRNTDPALGPRSSSTEPRVLDKVSYHLQAALQEIRDDPCGDLKWEQHCTKIYHLLAQAMELVVTQPKAEPNKALQSDLAAVMGGCDGTTRLPEVQDDKASTPK